VPRSALFALSTAVVLVHLRCADIVASVSYSVHRQALLSSLHHAAAIIRHMVSCLLCTRNCPSLDVNACAGSSGRKLRAAVYKPDMCLATTSKDMLRDLLSEVCSGFYRAGLLTELISPSEWYLQALHFVINTGTACFEVARSPFQYLLTAKSEALSCHTSS
jgi:hypothetical protein